MSTNSVIWTNHLLTNCLLSSPAWTVLKTILFFSWVKTKIENLFQILFLIWLPFAFNLNLLFLNLSRTQKYSILRATAEMFRKK